MIISQNPNEDTEWNDILRAKGIIPPKEAEVTEDDILGMMEQAVKEKTEGKGVWSWVWLACCWREAWRGALP